MAAPECRVLGLAYGELLQGKSYRARSIRFSRPSFDALVNRDKPVEPFVKRPLMVNEALAAIRQPLQVDSLSITNGHLTYCERVVAGADPGVLTFGTFSISVEGIGNRAEANAAIQIQAQGDFMNAGVLKVLMTIPVTPPDFSFHYSGSLGAMDLTRLDAFLDIAERTRIKSGSAQAAVPMVCLVTAQLWAAFSVQLPVLEMQAPTQKMRNGRWRKTPKALPMEELGAAFGSRTMKNS